MKFSFFGDAPDEVVSQLSLKKPELHFDYDEIRFNAHQRAFAVAKITRLDLLSDIQLSLENALKKGQNFKEWKQEIIPTLAKKGWWGDKVEVVNPKNPEDKRTITVDDRRLKTIFNTNIKTAYAMANYDAGVASGAKYIRYVAVLDGRTRQDHKDLHGIVKPIDDKFWEKNYPPNGWNCRCSVMFLTEAELGARNYKVSNLTIPDVAEPDWAYHVGKNTSDLMSIYKDKIANLENKKLEADFIEQSKKDFLATLSERIQNLSIWQNIKSFFNADEKSKNNQPRVKLSGVSPALQKAFNNPNLQEIYLSEQTVASHKHHSNITPWDYFLLKKLLEKNIKDINQSKKFSNHRVVKIKYLKAKYRVILKETTNNEIYIQSVTKGSNVW